MAAEAAQAKPQFEGADAAAQAVHAAKPADALTTVLGSPAGLHYGASRATSPRRIYYLVWRRRNRPARRLAAAQLSEAINACRTRNLCCGATRPPPHPRWRGRGVDALRRDARQRKYAGRVARLLLRGHAGRQLSAGHARPARDGGTRVGRVARVVVDAAARSLWKGCGPSYI